MLSNSILNFLAYCKTAGFSEKSRETLTYRLGEFNNFLTVKTINSATEITYSHLFEFIADYLNPSIHVKKARVWSLRQFFHFLKVNKIIDKNIALEIPYPKVDKTVPRFLTKNEFNKILEYFAKNTNTPSGLRNLIIIMLLGFLGLRLSAILRLNIESVDLESNLIWIQDKGDIIRSLYLPQVVSILLTKYLEMMNLNQGPLFLSKRRKRISERTLQDIFKEAMAELGFDKHLHAHLFRHTAGTHLNKVAGPVITQFVLGHVRHANTKVYTHLNPDQYAEYMKKHPYHHL